jgi:hypothetical protein
MAPRAEPTGVFLVRLRAVFRSGFRLTPINSWRSESSTSCMDVSSFQCARAASCVLPMPRRAWMDPRPGLGILSKRSGTNWLFDYSFLFSCFV